MRRILSYAPNEVVKFIPKAFGNRSDPQPVTVTYKALDVRGKRLLLDEIASISGVAASEDAVIRARLLTVANYMNANGDAIVDAETLIQHGEWEIIREVSDEILLSGSLTEDEQKKFDGSSGFCRSATPESIETVEGVRPAAWIGSVTATEKAIPSTSTQQKQE